MSLFSQSEWEESTPNPDGQTPLAVSGSEAVKRVSQGALLLDVREPDEWIRGHARCALSIPLHQLPELAAEKLDPSLPIIVVCASGRRSNRAANWLREAGYCASNLQGGMPAWILADGEMA